MSISYKFAKLNAKVIEKSQNFKHYISSKKYEYSSPKGLMIVRFLLEKEDNKKHGETGGYLKTLDYKEAFKESYNKASKEDRKKIFNIPNFDADKFLEISGIDVRIDSEQESKKQALIAKANELLEQAKNM